MIGSPHCWTYPSKIDVTIPIRERARINFEKRRANFLAQIERQKEIRRQRAKSLQVQKPKPIKTPPVVLPTMVSNVIDLNNHRAKATAVVIDEPNACVIDEPNAGIKCRVLRPDYWAAETFYFGAVPEVGSEIILEDVSRRYILRSVAHLATKPGSAFRPIIELHLRSRRKKKR
jgi:hypothetical protein